MWVLFFDFFILFYSVLFLLLRLECNGLFSADATSASWVRVMMVPPQQPSASWVWVMVPLQQSSASWVQVMMVGSGDDGSTSAALRLLGSGGGSISATLHLLGLGGFSASGS